ncbi:MAG: hypothetical protein L0Z50_41675 [Verrucomicrobiales bacterium]|nr:hypothetical protein [Verrucomicrobiales bacterium]
MEDAAVVGELHGFGDGLQVSSRLFGQERMILHQSREVRSIDIIHHQKMLAFVQAHFMDRDDVGVLQAARRRGFNAEAANLFSAGQRTE